MAGLRGWERGGGLDETLRRLVVTEGRAAVKRKMRPRRRHGADAAQAMRVSLLHPGVIPVGRQPIDPGRAAGDTTSLLLLGELPCGFAVGNGLRAVARRAPRNGTEAVPYNKPAVFGERASENDYPGTKDVHA